MKNPPQNERGGSCDSYYRDFLPLKVCRVFARVVRSHLNNGFTVTRVYSAQENQLSNRHHISPRAIQSKMTNFYFLFKAFRLFSNNRFQDFFIVQKRTDIFFIEV